MEATSYVPSIAGVYGLADSPPPGPIRKKREAHRYHPVNPDFKRDLREKHPPTITVVFPEGEDWGAKELVLPVLGKSHALKRESSKCTEIVKRALLLEGSPILDTSEAVYKLWKEMSQEVSRTYEQIYAIFEYRVKAPLSFRNRRENFTEKEEKFACLVIRACLEKNIPQRNGHDITTFPIAYYLLMGFHEFLWKDSSPKEKFGGGNLIKTLTERVEILIKKHNL